MPVDKKRTKPQTQKHHGRSVNETHPHDDLEKEVAARTVELRQANRKLKMRTTSLAESNTALKVLLKQRVAAKRE